MILLTIVAFVAVAALLIHAIRLWQRERILLYIFVPILLVGALLTGRAIDRLLGFPTGDLSDLSGEFFFVSVSGHDPVYLLAVPNGSPAPRLYAIPRDMLSEEEWDGLSQARAKAGKGVPQNGVLVEGELEMYDFDVPEMYQKDTPP
jgi:hypothetical protein